MSFYKAKKETTHGVRLVRPGEIVLFEDEESPSADLWELCDTSGAALTTAAVPAPLGADVPPSLLLDQTEQSTKIANLENMLAEANAGLASAHSELSSLRQTYADMETESKRLLAKAAEENAALQKQMAEANATPGKKNK